MAHIDRFLPNRGGGTRTHTVRILSPSIHVRTRPLGSENAHKKAASADDVLARTYPDVPALVYNWCTEGVRPPRHRTGATDTPALRLCPSSPKRLEGEFSEVAPALLRLHTGLVDQLKARPTGPALYVKEVG